MRTWPVYSSGLAAVLVAASLAAAMLVSGSRAAPAAQIQRTFVSTSGNDANPCTRTAPCRNFGVALANTLRGGEVVALDSGGYGVVTVADAVTIVGAPGAHVAITAFSTDAITVNADSTDTVVLRNLYLTGLGGAFRGIYFQAGGSLHVESVVVSGFTNGLVAAATDSRVFVVDSRFRQNEFGLGFDGAQTAEIEHTRADANGTGGFVFANGAVATVRSSAATLNGSTGFGLSPGGVATIEGSLADGNGDYGVVVFDEASASLTGDVLSNNGTAGLYTVNAGSVARIGGSTVTGSETGLLRGNGTLESYGDNLVRGNTTNTSGTITTVTKT